jgi:hypothetical protein
MVLEFFLNVPYFTRLPVPHTFEITSICTLGRPRRRQLDNNKMDLG